MKFIARPVMVDAFKIYAVSDRREDGSVRIELEDGTIKRGNSVMLARFMPGVGDYWVVQDDGYEYVNPAAVFTRKYRPIEMTFPPILHEADGIQIRSDGTIMGTPERIEAFREFLKSRDGLLAGV